jgi:PKD repeat protein
MNRLIAFLLLIAHTAFLKSEEAGVPVINGNVTISGNIQVESIIKAEYDYDSDNAPESGTTFRWYLANNSSGADAVLISSAGNTLQLMVNHEDKYIRVEITPRDVNGNTGENYSSYWYGPIQKAEQINNPPVALNVRIRGNPVYCGVLTGTYDYTDPELDEQGETSYRWLRASGPGSTLIAIPGANADSYTISTDDKDKIIYFEVTPRARSGSTSGSPVTSQPTIQITGALPSVTFTGNASICEGADAIINLAFTGTPPFSLEYTNGTKNFTLSTSNTTYALKVNSGGTYKGTRLTDIMNCPVTNLPSTAIISTKPKPDLSFSTVNACYTGDTTLFRNTSGSKGSIKGWSWNFGDNTAPSGQNTSALESPKHKYPAAGNYPVRLAAENNEGCRDTVVKTILLEDKPIADIKWDKECYTPGLNVSFQNNSTTSGNISKYSWVLRDAVKVVKESASGSFTQTIPSNGKYTVELKITTESGCKDSVTKTFSAKPVIKLVDSMYSDNLESADTWNIESTSKNNWYRGDPPGPSINSPHSGGQAYYTYFPEKRQNQQLIVTSPCFDFTSLQKPFIDLWLNHGTQESKEGAVLQYTQDGSANWTTVGTLHAGQNWYNNNDISASPGNQLLGWSGNSEGWKQARHNLEMLSNKTNVRFRIVYATAADASAGEGFAFDDLFIGQRGKKVLLEHFTNLSDAFSIRSNEVFDSVMIASGPNATGIQYHTSFPGTDTLNEHNKAHPAARALFYGIGKVPVSYLDGGIVQNYIYDYTNRKMNTGDISNRSFEDPGFDIRIQAEIAGNAVAGNVQLTAIRNFSGSDNVLHIAIVEDISVIVSGKAKTLKNVLKYLVPSSGGTAISTTWEKDQTSSIVFSWPMANVFNPTKLKVIAFVQNNQTKEVFQVEQVQVSGTISVGNADKLQPVILYPNPASRRITLQLNESFNEPFHLHIITSSGIVADKMIIPKGVSLFDFSVETLPTGLYLLNLRSSSGFSKTFKLTVER